jgi:acetyl esterase/lipase
MIWPKNNLGEAMISRRMTYKSCRALVFGCLLALICTSQGAAVEPEKINIWKDVKLASGDSTEEVFMTVHRPDRPNGRAIVICPGGGYGTRVSGAEGHGIAKWLNTHDITGVVLDYRLPKGRSIVPLSDAQRAIRVVRANAEKWQLKRDRIGIMGFSAGGHLASTAGTHFDNGDSKNDDPVEQLSCRPDFMILVYPVISLGKIGHAGTRKNLLGKDPSAELVNEYSNELQVNNQTPPTFLAHAVDDKPVPIENSRAFYKALLGVKAKAKLLELPSGGHGLNGYKGPMWDAWQEQSIAWLQEL